ncbi:hypothetical protein J45TS6_47400 [Paenibacillus sp. J45TS6]|nr:hypothetical protein [Paenibacillus sp. J45TS6]GIP46281.1 hypothetical protein J45TS6_47400 [Paenibacillus sp. J45TS6]
MSDRVRVEVTFNEKKHADILEAMKQYGSQAGFLKFAAVYFLNATKNEGSTTAAPAPKQSTQQPAIEATTAKPATEKRRKLPPGIGGQAFTSRMKD